MTDLVHERGRHPKPYPGPLHPVFAVRLHELAARVIGTGLAVFETWRTPGRQAQLYARGRTAPGRKVTNARPWFSFHQYGCAADLVVWDGTRWHWPPASDRVWRELADAAAAVGLVTLRTERPHVQLAGVGIRELRRARVNAPLSVEWCRAVAYWSELWPAGAPVGYDVDPDRPAAHGMRADA